MSQTAIHLSKGARRLCESCRARKARFRFRGVVRADKNHTLCFECFRSERDRRGATLLGIIEPPQPVLPSAARKVPLTPLQVAHRHRMLSHLASAVPR